MRKSHDYSSMDAAKAAAGFVRNPTIEEIPAKVREWQVPDLGTIQISPEWLTWAEKVWPGDCSPAARMECAAAERPDDPIAAAWLASVAAAPQITRLQVIDPVFRLSYDDEPKGNAPHNKWGQGHGTTCSCGDCRWRD